MAPGAYVPMSCTWCLVAT